jgi:hypothetical protein
LHLFSQIAKSAQSQVIIADAKGPLLDYRHLLTRPSGSGVAGPEGRQLSQRVQLDAQACLMLDGPPIIWRTRPVVGGLRKTTNAAKLDYAFKLDCGKNGGIPTSDQRETIIKRLTKAIERHDMSFVYESQDYKPFTMLIDYE